MKSAPTLVRRAAVPVVAVGALTVAVAPAVTSLTASVNAAPVAATAAGCPAGYKIVNGACQKMYFGAGNLRLSYRAGEGWTATRGAAKQKMYFG